MINIVGIDQGFFNYFVAIFIKSLILIGLTGIILSILKKSSPAFRTTIHRLLLVSLLSLPILCYLFPHWSINVFSTSISNNIPFLIKLTNQTVTGDTSSSTTLSISNIIVFTWLIGMMILSMRILIGVFYSHKIIKHAKIIEDNGFNDISLRCEINLQIDKEITYRSSDLISSPIVTGWFKPAIILPTYTLVWPEERIKMILFHELAHIKRNDTIWFILSSIVTALHWFNPLIWIIRKKFISDSEKLCDDYVLYHGSDAGHYAESILSIVKNMKYNRLNNLAGICMARQSELEGRLMAIVKSKKRVVNMKNSVVRSMIVMTIAFLIPLSSFQLFAGEKYPDPDEVIKLDKMPELIEMTNPAYPKEAKEKGIEGDVWIQALVDTTGTVKKVLIKKTSGSELLDKPAVDAAYKNKFSPGIKDKKPVACWVTYKVSFVLDDKKPEKNNDE